MPWTWMTVSRGELYQKVLNLRCYRGVRLVISIIHIMTAPFLETTTGMDHCVRPVTKGERKALILWTKSDVSNPFLREISSLAQKASLIIRDEKERKGINPYLYPEGIEDASNDPHFLLNKIITIIARAES